MASTGGPGTPSPPRVPASAALTGLVAVVTVLALELVRFSGPLLDVAYGRGGVPAVAGAAAVTYLAPAPVVAVLCAVPRAVPRLRSSAWPALAAGAALLTILRVLVQALQGDARLAVGLGAVAVAVAVLTLAVAALAARPGGGPAAAGAVAAGAAAGVGLQLVLGTWDAGWRHSTIGWSVTGVTVGTLVLLTVLVAGDRSPAVSVRVRRLWVLGPFLGLAAMMLANPAFAAAQSGWPLALAGSLQALGWLLAGALVGRRWASAPWAAVLAGVLLVSLVALALAGDGSSGPTGVVTLVAVLGGQLAATWLLGAALSPPDRTRPVRSARPQGAVAVAGRARELPVTAGLVGLLTIVPLLLYQADYDLPLPVDHALVLVAAAAALAAAGLRRSSTVGEVRDALTRRLLVPCSVVVLAGVVVTGAGWSTQGRAAEHAGREVGPGSGRVLSWNVHYGVDGSGAVDLEAVARTIEEQRPDVVLLQEVSRGWVLGGGADMAGWLAHRLGWQFAFAPAADRRFGNVILSPGQPANVRITALPFGAGPQQRSAVTAEVRVGSTTMDVTSVHLQNRRSNGPTRSAQVQALLADLAAADRGRASLIGGDFNALPGTTEIARLTDAGWVSAVDAVGDPAALTSPSRRPSSRIDWVFGRGVTLREAQVLTGVQSSDHLPLVVTLGP